jgi:hypothetical protein
MWNVYLKMPHTSLTHWCWKYWNLNIHPKIPLCTAPLDNTQDDPNLTNLKENCSCRCALHWLPYLVYNLDGCCHRPTVLRQLSGSTLWVPCRDLNVAPCKGNLEVHTGPSHIETKPLGETEEDIPNAWLRTWRWPCKERSEVTPIPWS